LRTVGIAVFIVSGFALWSLYFTALPLWLAAPLGSVLVTWYGSLQHETIHGHPTPSRRINAAIGGLPLSLWMPYPIYRESHIRHHRHSRQRLTEVGHDPESFYLPPGRLARVGRLQRAILQANCTLAGRLTLGPAIAVAVFWAQELRQVLSNRRRRRIWLEHALGTAAVLGWLIGVCHIPFLVYVLLVLYPSASLTHLRSFAEHRADDQSHLRTNVVEAHPLWALIFLNNNLHVAHHAYPHVPWYYLPRVWRNMRGAGMRAEGIFKGYGEVARQFLFRPFITAEHPFSRLEVK
jgi:fatty acid desaturase